VSHQIENYLSSAFQLDSLFVLIHLNSLKLHTELPFGEDEPSSNNLSS